jgi:hypothetical protein
MARRQYQGNVKVTIKREKSLSKAEYIPRDADYIRAANLFNLSCNLDGVVGYMNTTTNNSVTDTNDIKQFIKSGYKKLNLKYHPDKAKHLGEAGKECFNEATMEYDLLDKETNISDISSRICVGGAINSIDANDRDVGDPIHDVFKYCDNPTLYDFNDYIFYVGFLPHEVDRVNSILRHSDPNFDFDKVDPALQGNMMELAAFLEEFRS